MLKVDRSYWLPVCISVILHLGLLLWLGGDWASPSHRQVTPPPAYVTATLVELKPKTINASAAKAPEKKPIQKVDLAKQKREAEQQKQAELEKQRKLTEKKEADAKAKQKALAEKRQQELDAKAAEEAKQKEEKQKELARQQQLQQQAFADALAEEQTLLAEQQSAATAQSYAAVIQEKIIRSWSRPPSARNGMVCWLRIQLIPSGEVVNVVITKSSGNDAFDRSAEQAVRLAGRFEVLRGVSPDIFEKYFRQMAIKFDPKDLRQ